MCSSVFGPAMPPPLVTWPTTNTAMPVSLANRIRRPAHSRPGRHCPARSRCVGVRGLDRVADQDAGSGRAGRVEDGLEAGLPQHQDRPRVLVDPVGAQPDLFRALLAAGVQHGGRPGRARAAAWSRSVTCRCPGSPPISVIEPGTSAAAEDEIELGDARWPTAAAWWRLMSRSGHRRRGPRSAGRRRHVRGRRPCDRLFGDRVPVAAASHRPAHFGCSWPHSAQRYTDRGAPCQEGPSRSERLSKRVNCLWK
jgi:hypothetical protein